jgi:hypothetical protein
MLIQSSLPALFASGLVGRFGFCNDVMTGSRVWDTRNVLGWKETKKREPVHIMGFFLLSFGSWRRFFFSSV